MQHTFVIPAYKQSLYLEDCITSLRAQTADTHIILTTSTPSAYLEETARKYQLPYIINPVTNSGIADDWNFALQQAATPLVTIAHQDDIYEPDYAACVIQHIIAAPRHPLIAFTDYTDVVNDRMRKHSLNAVVKRTLLLPFRFSNAISSNFLKRSILLLGDPICCPSVTFNMAALSGFAFDADYKCALDWMAWLELAQAKGSFVYVNRKLVRHRIHTESETALQINNGMRLAEEQRIFELLWGKRIARMFTRLYAAGHHDNL